MIKSNKIQEWIEEIETRPMAAPFIVRTLSSRVIELDKINEELRAENIQLRSGKKIEEYERKIAELEYQIELLKRHVTDGAPIFQTAESLLLIYDAEGRLAAVDFSSENLVHDHALAALQNFVPPHRDDIHMLAVNSQDELLYLFDSGRIDTTRAGDLAPGEHQPLDWDATRRIEMRSGERLITIMPITQAPMQESCIQISRKGLARRIPKDYFQTFLQERSLGKGVRTTADQPMNLALCDPQDVYVLISRGGYISAMPAGQLSITLEEMIRLEMQDYLVSAFILQPDQKLVIALESGEIYLQDNPWKDPEDADRSKRRLLLGGTRAGGLHMLGGAAAGDDDWVLFLTNQGEIRMTHLAAVGQQKRRQTRQPVEAAAPMLAFCVWETQASAGNEG